MKKILWLALILAVIGGSIGYYYYNKEVGGLKNVTPDFSMEATELFNEFSENEGAANKKYLGKVLEINGVVKSTAVADSGKYNVMIESGDEMSGISCEVNSKTNPSVKKLKSGNNIKIKGVCSGMLLDVVLVNCAIEKE